MSNANSLDEVDGYLLLCAIHASSGADPFFEKSLSAPLLQRVRERRGESSKSIRDTVRDVERRGLSSNARQQVRSFEDFLSTLIGEQPRSAPKRSER